MKHLKGENDAYDQSDRKRPNQSASGSDQDSVPYEQMKVFFRRDYAALHAQDERLAMNDKEELE